MKICLKLRLLLEIGQVWIFYIICVCVFVTFCRFFKPDSNTHFTVARVLNCRNPGLELSTDAERVHLHNGLTLYN